ncbi:MAG: hypothetical protein AAF532_04565 [Planctomycetota bacterium]
MPDPPAAERPGLSIDMIASDLFLASSCRGTAVSAGASFRQHVSVAKFAAAEASDGPVLCDLTLRDAEPETVRDAAAGRVLVGYAPHRQVGRLKAAREAGFDVVTTNSGLADVLRRVLQQGPTASD